MRRPADLSREELLEVVCVIQQELYLDFEEATQTVFWNPEKEWNPADVCETMAGTLALLGLVPEAKMPFSHLS